MSTVGVVLEKIRERRVREGYREPRAPRERMPPDLAVPCARYPTAALLCFVAAVGGIIAAILLLIVLVVVATSTPGPISGPAAVPAVKAAPPNRR
jgi:hypothetical protein